MIRNLVFDFGKVLVDYEYMPVLEWLFDSQEDQDEFARCILTEEWVSIIEIENQPFEATIEDMKKAYPKFTRQIDAYARLYNDFVTGPVPGMKDLLIELKARGFKLYGLSNWCSKVYHTIDRFSDIFSLLDDRIISCEEHMIKPNSDIYHRLLNKFSLKADECLFTDDKAVNIAGAIAAGMDAVQFHNAEQYKAELKARNLL